MTKRSPHPTRRSDFVTEDSLGLLKQLAVTALPTRDGTAALDGVGCDGEAVCLLKLKAEYSRLR